MNVHERLSLLLAEGRDHELKLEAAQDFMAIVGFGAELLECKQGDDVVHIQVDGVRGGER